MRECPVIPPLHDARVAMKLLHVTQHLAESVDGGSIDNAGHPLQGRPCGLEHADSISSLEDLLVGRVKIVDRQTNRLSHGRSKPVVLSNWDYSSSAGRSPVACTPTPYRA